MHFHGDQSVLANSIGRFKVVTTVSDSLYRATSMDCTVLIPGTGNKVSTYRVRWRIKGATRMDMKSSDGTEHTLWTSDPAKPPSFIWQPAMELMTPTVLARNMEQRYRLMKTMRQDGAESSEFLLVGSEDQQRIEIAVDGRTYLPKTLIKYSQDSGQTNEDGKCLIEARFKWNQPIARDLLVPGFHDAQ